MQEIMTSGSNTDSFSSLPFYLGYFVLFFLFLWLLQTFFVPYYKTHLKDKIRRWIVLSHLDSSGKQIKKNRSEDLDSDSDSTYPLLDNIEILENIFGL